MVLAPLTLVGILLSGCTWSTVGLALLSCSSKPKESSDLRGLYSFSSFSTLQLSQFSYPGHDVNSTLSKSKELPHLPILSLISRGEALDELCCTLMPVSNSWTARESHSKGRWFPDRVMVTNLKLSTSQKSDCFRNYSLKLTFWNFSISSDCLHKGKRKPREWKTFQFSSVQSLSHVRLFATQGLQHTRLPCPSPTLRAYSNSCPSTQ